MTHQNCLQRADDIVHGNRNDSYGEPRENHETTAAIFSEFMRRRYGTFPEITGEDVCWFNIAQKMSREAHCKTPDGLTDICGYTANIEIIRSGKTVAEIRAQRSIEQIRKVAEVCGAVQSVHTTTATNPDARDCSHCHAPAHGNGVPCVKALATQVHANKELRGPKSPHNTVGENKSASDDIDEIDEPLRDK